MPSATPLLPHHIRNMILILRCANAHYTQVAARIRATLTPTHHAKKRAQRLGLVVDIKKARNCSQKQVSNIPLPIIEVPPVALRVAPGPPCYATSPYSPPLVQPLAKDQALNRGPALKCTIPAIATLTRTTPGGTTSALLTEPFSTITLDAEARYSSQCATSVGERSPSIQGAKSNSTVWRPLDVLIDENAMEWGMEFTYPDTAPMAVSPFEPPSTPPLVPRSGASSTLSQSPVTPPSRMLPPLIDRIKRKSIEIRGKDNMKRVKVFHDDGQAQHQRKDTVRFSNRKE